MSKDVKIELDHGGIRELLRGEGVKAMLSGYADRALASLGGGYKKSEHTGAGRANVSVYAKSGAAKRENAENNTILKAVKGL